MLGWWQCWDGGNVGTTLKHGAWIWYAHRGAQWKLRPLKKLPEKRKMQNREKILCQIIKHCIRNLINDHGASPIFLHTVVSYILFSPLLRYSLSHILTAGLACHSVLTSPQDFTSTLTYYLARDLSRHLASSLASQISLHLPRDLPHYRRAALLDIVDSENLSKSSLETVTARLISQQAMQTLCRLKIIFEGEPFFWTFVKNRPQFFVKGGVVYDFVTNSTGDPSWNVKIGDHFQISVLFPNLDTIGYGIAIWSTISGEANDYSSQVGQGYLA
uniref:Uncharacterized protein n=1 Tax=Romanomermis culicivorax TaxID=13658 RepID=A0A915JTN9_ROMCU